MECAGKMRLETLPFEVILSNPFDIHSQSPELNGRCSLQIAPGLVVLYGYTVCVLDLQVQRVSPLFPLPILRDFVMVNVKRSFDAENLSFI